MSGILPGWGKTLEIGIICKKHLSKKLRKLKKIKKKKKINKHVSSFEIKFNEVVFAKREFSDFWFWVVLEKRGSLSIPAFPLKNKEVFREESMSIL